MLKIMATVYSAIPSLSPSLFFTCILFHFFLILIKSLSWLILPLDILCIQQRLLRLNLLLERVRWSSKGLEKYSFPLTTTAWTLTSEDDIHTAD